MLGKFDYAPPSEIAEKKKKVVIKNVVFNK